MAAQFQVRQSATFRFSNATFHSIESQTFPWLPLERSGVHAQGLVGDTDPVQAIADALALLPADEIVVAAHPTGSHGLADELLSRARERFALPIVHAQQAFPHAA